jgi:hypothetical protein
MTTATLRAAVLLSILAVQSRAAAQAQPPKYGPAGAPRAVTLALDRAYLQNPTHPSPDFWALAGYYVPQIGPAACSAASLAMVLNAARARLPKRSDEKLITQEALVERVKVDCWAERVTTGCQGRAGATLDLYAKVVAAAFVQYGFPQARVRVVHVPDRSVDVRRALVADLRANERTAQNFIIANFDQKAFTDDTSVGHMAPLAAFDEERSRVLVLDPDREWYEPYWVSVDTLLDGLATRDSETGAPRGYLVVEL